MPSPSKRLEFLLKITASGSKDPFAWYGLAMEYRSLERPDEALAAFERLREIAPTYVPTYLMCGQLLIAMNRRDEARSWLNAGIQAAGAKGDGHASAELQAALDSIP